MAASPLTAIRIDPYMNIASASPANTKMNCRNGMNSGWKPISPSVAYSDLISITDDSDVIVPIDCEFLKYAGLIFWRVTSFTLGSELVLL